MRISIIILCVSMLFGFVSCNEKTSLETKLKADVFEEMLITNSNVQLVDVRTAMEHYNGHLKNSVNIDFYSANFEKDALATLDKNKPVLLYCKKGGRSSKALNKLKEAGFVEVYDLQGGYDSWIAYNKAIVSPIVVKKEELTFEEALKGDKLIMVDFTAVWCGPCQQMAPSIEKLKEELKEDISIVKVDVDDQKDVAQKYRIEAMPTLVFIKNGKEVYREMGGKSEDDLRKLIESQIKSNS